MIKNVSTNNLCTPTHIRGSVIKNVSTNNLCAPSNRSFGHKGPCQVADLLNFSFKYIRFPNWQQQYQETHIMDPLLQRSNAVPFQVFKDSRPLSLSTVQSKSLFQQSRLSVHRTYVRTSQKFFSLKSPWNHPLTPGVNPGVDPGQPRGTQPLRRSQNMPAKRAFSSIEKNNNTPFFDP